MSAHRSGSQSTLKSFFSVCKIETLPVPVLVSKSVTYLSTYLLACLLTYLFTYLVSKLLTYLLTYLLPSLLT